jgi:hypothetical protein
LLACSWPLDHVCVGRGPGRAQTVRPGSTSAAQLAEYIPAAHYSEIFMPTEVFRASRWTKGNLLFPTVIEVSDKAVTRRKRSWFNQDEMSITISKVASVHIKTGMVWSDVLIESSGGSDPMASHGHTKADAQRIKELVENAQAVLAQQRPQDQS